MHVIEFQKRGLPHAHILIILVPEDKPTLNDYDKIVCAKIPDKDTQPLLYETVVGNMVHGPHEKENSKKISSCMDNENRICEKNYPKEYADTTSVNKFGYPIYRRKDNSRTITNKGQALNN